MKLEGVHHVTAITGDAPGNVDFYARVLGLRLVKKSVNQDDPTVYHLFYGDDEGTPGNDITFFEYPECAAGPRRRRDGAPGRLARSARTRRSSFWEERLGTEGVTTERTADGSLRFSDPEGLGHRARRRPRPPDEPLVADDPEIPAELALQGFDGVRAYSRDPEASRAFLEEALEFDAARRGRLGGARRAARRLLRDTTARDERGASRARAPFTTSRGPRRWTSTRRGSGASPRRRLPTPVIDRYYFKSIYFREPSGVLFEIATIGARASRRTSRSRCLGERLSLPPDYEQLRDQARAGADAAAEPARRAARRSDRSSTALGRRPQSRRALLVLFHGARRRRERPVPAARRARPGAAPRSASLRAGRSRCRRAARTGTRVQRDRLSPTRRRSCRPTRRVGVARRLWRRDGHRAGADRARRLLAGRGDDATRSGSAGTPASRRARRAERLHPDRRGLELDLEPPLPPVAIGHGTYDPVISVEWGRRAKALLEDAGAQIVYREYPLPHAVDPGFLAELVPWIPAALAARRDGGLTTGSDTPGTGWIGVLRGGGDGAARHAARRSAPLRRGARTRSGSPSTSAVAQARTPSELLRRGWTGAGDRRGGRGARARFGDCEDAAFRLERPAAGRGSSFQEAAWPDADLVNSSFALPFCPPMAFPGLWRRIERVRSAPAADSAGTSSATATAGPARKK